ncbi:MAG: amidohydrolase family protein [Gemmatimonadota bacterium]|nr:amidohydrolase family protein [Gemmatimonadota bacterium]
MTRIAKFALAALCSISVSLAPGSSVGQETTAITDVSIVDVETGEILPGSTVVIEGGRIVSVAEGADVPAAATTIDGSGRFLMPGLWDMHAHMRADVAPTVLMPQFIASGVTGVREMASDCAGGGVCLADMLEWRERIDAGELPGPRIIQLSSAPINPPFGGGAGENGMRTLVRRAHDRGADLIKVYYRLDPEALGWIVDEAEALGMYAGGHIPIRMTAAEVSEAGLRTLEHARDFLFDCFPGSADFRATTTSQNPPMDVMRSMVDDHQPEVCDATFATFVRNGTWYVPTHVTRRMDAYANDPDFRDDPRRIYIPADAWDSWQADADGMVALDPSPEGRRIVRGFYEKGLELTGRAHDAGVNILLGTDAGDTYVFPGSGAHDELGELVKAGLTPAEALATGTINAARFAGLEDEHGTVAVGKRADLVLLEANPLEDIANTRGIAAVVLGGRVYDRVELDAMLEGVVARIAEYDAGG